MFDTTDLDDSSTTTDEYGNVVQPGDGTLTLRYVHPTRAQQAGEDRPAYAGPPDPVADLNWENALEMYFPHVSSDDYLSKVRHWADEAQAWADGQHPDSLLTVGQGFTPAEYGHHAPKPHPHHYQPYAMPSELTRRDLYHDTGIAYPVKSGITLRLLQRERWLMEDFLASKYSLAANQHLQRLSWVRTYLMFGQPRTLRRMLLRALTRRGLHEIGAGWAPPHTPDDAANRMLWQLYTWDVEQLIPPLAYDDARALGINPALERHHDWYGRSTSEAPTAAHAAQDVPPLPLPDPHTLHGQVEAQMARDERRQGSLLPVVRLQPWIDERDHQHRPQG